MNLSQIELLRVLQETNFNLSKAAERMHIVQSAVSRVHSKTQKPTIE